MALAEMPAGTRIGAYTVVSDLSSGGMGNVYVARDEAGHEVTLKFPHISMIGDPALYERYQRELTIGRTLRHPRVQRVLDAGEHEGHPYMVTEYVPGITLRAFLDAHAPLPIPEALHILDELCDGIGYCHEQGIFHRDLKPENILISATGDITIIDFGIALMRGARRITWAGLSATVGTPDYMAPEQVEGKRGDARTDIYSLGAIGFELLCGEPPFTGDNPLVVMRQHLYGEIHPLTERNPQIPVALDAVIRKALSREPADRFQSVSAFREALREYATTDIVAPVATPRRRFLSNHPLLRQIISYTLVIGAIMLAIVLIGVLAQIAHGGR